MAPSENAKPISRYDAVARLGETQGEERRPGQAEEHDVPDRAGAGADGHGVRAFGRAQAPAAGGVLRGGGAADHGGRERRCEADRGRPHQ